VTKNGEKSKFSWNTVVDQNFSRQQLILGCLSLLKKNYGENARLSSIYTLFKSDTSFSGYSEQLTPFMQSNYYTYDKLNSPSHYNFGEVIPGLVYRSRHLGVSGLTWLQKWLTSVQRPFIKSIASVHVYGYGGGKFKHKLGSLIMPEYFNLTYNIEEYDFAKCHDLQFLHSYSPDPQMRVYFDGEDPSDIPENDSSHGNIYRNSTLALYLSETAINLMNININHDPVAGDTYDFLTSLLNIIEAPWPILMHCKGGKHKTGMLAMVFSWLYKTEIEKDSYYDFENFWDSELKPSYYQFNSDPEEKNLKFVKNLLTEKILGPENSKHRILWSLIKKKFVAKFEKMRKWSLEEEARIFLETSSFTGILVP